MVNVCCRCCVHNGVCRIAGILAAPNRHQPGAQPVRSEAWGQCAHRCDWMATLHRPAHQPFLDQTHHPDG
jgi:hypothetical protein